MEPSLDEYEDTTYEGAIDARIMAAIPTRATQPRSQSAPVAKTSAAPITSGANSSRPAHDPDLNQKWSPFGGGWALYDERSPPPVREADGSYMQLQINKQIGKWVKVILEGTEGLKWNNAAEEFENSTN